MTRIIKSQDCGKSPKNLLVQTLVIAIETRNASLFSRCVADDVVWAIPGRKSFDGKETGVAYLKSLQPDAPVRLVVRRAISHGRAGAGDGMLIRDGTLATSFCHVVDFSSVKGDRVSRISSYYSDIGEDA